MEQTTQRTDSQSLSVRKITGPGFIESMRGFSKNPSNYLPFIQEIYNTHGDIASYYLPTKRVGVFHPELAKKILTTSFRDVTKSKFYGELRPYQGNGLVISEGEDWLRQRRLVSQDFLNKNLALWAPVMTNEVENFSKQWMTKAENGTTSNIVPDMNRLTFNVLCNALLGRELHGILDDLYRELNLGIELVAKRLFSPVKFPSHWPTPINSKIKKSSGHLRNLIQKVIEDERKNPGGGFLGRVITSYDQAPNAQSLQTELLDVVVTMLVAGFETTANAINWTWANLMENPDIYDKLQAELKSVVGERSVLAEDLPKLKYMKAIINETMRLSPSIPFISREIQVDYHWNGFHLKKGMTVDFNLWQIQRHPEFWPNADKFDPSRFLVDKSEKDLVGFMPFAVGPRECLGKNFALQELQIILATLAKKFRLSLAPGFKVTPETNLVLRPKGGLEVNIKKA